MSNKSTQSSQITPVQTIKVGIVSGYKPSDPTGPGNKDTAQREKELGITFDYESKYSYYVHYHPTAGVPGFGASDGLTADSRYKRYQDHIGSIYASGKEVFYNLEFNTYNPVKTPNWVAVRDSMANRTGEYYESLVNFLTCARRDGRPLTLAVCHEANLGTGDYSWAINLPANYVGGTIDIVGYKKFFDDCVLIVEEMGCQDQVKILQVLINSGTITDPLTGVETTIKDLVNLNPLVKLAFDPYNFHGYLHKVPKTPKMLLEQLAQVAREAGKTFTLYETGSTKDMWRVASGTSTGAFTATLSNQVLTNPNPNKPTSGVSDTIYSITNGSSTVSIVDGGSGFADFTTHADTVPTLPTTVIGGQTITWNFEKYFDRATWWREFANAVNTDYADVVDAVTYFNGYGIPPFPNGRDYSYDFNASVKQAMTYAFGSIKNSSVDTFTLGQEFNEIPLQDSESISTSSIWTPASASSTLTNVNAGSNVLQLPLSGRTAVSAEGKLFTITKTNNTIGTWASAGMNLDVYFREQNDLPYCFGSWMRLAPTSPTNLEVIRMELVDSGFGGYSEPMFVLLTKEWRFVKQYTACHQTNAQFVNKLRIQFGNIGNQIAVQLWHPYFGRGSVIGNPLKSIKMSTGTMSVMSGSTTNSNTVGFSWKTLSGQNKNIVRYNLNDTKLSIFDGVLGADYSYDFAVPGYTIPVGEIRLDHTVLFANPNQGVFAQNGQGRITWSKTLPTVLSGQFEVRVEAIPNSRFARVINIATGNALTWVDVGIVAPTALIPQQFGGFDLSWSMNAEIR